MNISFSLVVSRTQSNARLNRPVGARRGCASSLGMDFISLLIIYFSNIW